MTTIAAMMRDTASRAVIFDAMIDRLDALPEVLRIDARAQIAALELLKACTLANAGQFDEAEARFYRAQTAIALLAN
jgi:hypothetical protein